MPEEDQHLPLDGEEVLHGEQECSQDVDPITGSVS
jgi:hypothetical protein